MKRKPITDAVKRGPLSDREKRFIEKNYFSKTDKEMAEILGRTVNLVMDYHLQYIQSTETASSITADMTEIKKELHAEPEWMQFQKQYTGEELSLFEHLYVQLVSQFKRDVMATEKMQIYQAINIQILLHRHNVERMKVTKDMERIERLLEREYKADVDDQEKALIMELEGQLAGLRNSSITRTREYKDLSDKFSNIVKDLKGTREQRIQKIEESKETFVGLIRKLEQEEMQRVLFVEHTLVRDAVKKEKKRLENYHEYMDGSIDKPLLTPDSA